MRDASHAQLAEHARPFVKAEICGEDHRGSPLGVAEEMEQKLPVDLDEWRLAELIANDEVEPGEIIGEPSLPAGSTFGLKPVDRVAGTAEPGRVTRRVYS
jgi:hypothetical protein